MRDGAGSSHSETPSLLAAELEARSRPHAGRRGSHHVREHGAGHDRVNGRARPHLGASGGMERRGGRRPARRARASWCRAYARTDRDRGEPRRLRRGGAQDAGVRPDSRHLAAIPQGPLFERLPRRPEHFEVVFDKLSTTWKTEPSFELSELERLAVPTLVISATETWSRSNRPPPSRGRSQTLSLRSCLAPRTGSRWKRPSSSVARWSRSCQRAASGLLTQRLRCFAASTSAICSARAARWIFSSNDASEPPVWWAVARQ